MSSSSSNDFYKHPLFHIEEYVQLESSNELFTDKEFLEQHCKDFVNYICDHIYYDRSKVFVAISLLEKFQKSCAHFELHDAQAILQTKKQVIDAIHQEKKEAEAVMKELEAGEGEGLCYQKTIFF